MILTNNLFFFIQCNFIDCYLDMKLMMTEDQKQIIRETCKSHSTKVSDRGMTFFY